MAALKIPEQHISGLIKLRTLDEKVLQELMKVLASAPLLLRPQELVDYIGAKIESKEEPDLNNLVETLIGLSFAQIQMELSKSEFVDRVCDAMRQSKNEHLKLVGEECDDFANRLYKLLSIEALTYPAKAAGVMADHDHVFVHSRILTDIRAIFGSDTEASPTGVVIVHMLNIGYQHAGKRDSFYVAMDSEDIEALISTLQRALSKTRGLKKLLNQTDVACLGFK